MTAGRPILLDKARELETSSFAHQYELDKEYWGEETFSLRGDWAKTNSGVTLSWSDVSVYVKCKETKFFGYSKSYHKKIINNVSGAVLPKTMVAIMGPSGSGKSTLMSALAHRLQGNTILDGEIRVNGHQIDDTMCNISGYMHQEDIFINALTVKEHLNFMAKLKMDCRIPSSLRERRVAHLINQLGLTSCAHSCIGGLELDSEKVVLSGGEKKRLSFATACLTDPPLLFCDEPTTGLDSYSAQRLISMMKGMSGTRTILCTIHQPSGDLLSMFDGVILVAEGQIVFSGPHKEAISFFKGEGYEMNDRCNPGEFLVDTLAPTPGSEMATKTAVKRLAHQYALSEHYKKTDMVVQYEKQIGKDCKGTMDLSNYKTPFWFYKLYLLWLRGIIEILRNPNLQWIRIFQKLVIALMAGLCYVGAVSLTQAGVQAVQGALFVLVTENTFAPMYAVLSLFPQEFPMFMREYSNRAYTPLLFYLAKIVATLPGLIFEAFLFTTCMYWLAGLRDTLYAYMMITFFTVLCINVSTACGTFFSTTFESASAAMAYLIPFDYVMMITSGLFVKLSTLPDSTSWVQYFSWLMYTYESMSIVQWNNVQNITCAEDQPHLPCMESGDQVLDMFSFSPDHLGRNTVALLLLYLGFHILGYMSFLKRIRNEM